jgi:hypothetical protein
MAKLIFQLFVIMTMVFTTASLVEAYGEEPKPDEVGIYSRVVEIPLNRIILIRKDNRYCALKFTKAWIEMDEERLKLAADYLKQGGVTAESARESAEKKYANYVSYYNKNSALDFAGTGIQQKNGTASLLPLRGPFWPLVYQPGNGCVECGEFELLWSYKTGVAFIPLGKGSSMRDYGIELAPTPWTDIKEVNVKDPRIKWYRYDESRDENGKRMFIPIDKLWADKEMGNRKK